MHGVFTNKNRFQFCDGVNAAEFDPRSSAPSPAISTRSMYCTFSLLRRPQGTFNTFNKVTGSLGDTISQLSLDTDYRRRRVRERLVEVRGSNPAYMMRHPSYLSCNENVPRSLLFPQPQPTFLLLVWEMPRINFRVPYPQRNLEHGSLCVDPLWDISRLLIRLKSTQTRLSFLANGCLFDVPYLCARVFFCSGRDDGGQHGAGC